MGQELTHLHYVNCPNCLTMFKPRNIPRKLTDNIRCVCCGNVFILGQSSLHHQKTKAKQRPQKKKVKAKKVNLPTIVNRPLSKTNKYLRNLKTTSSVNFLAWVTAPAFVMFLACSSLYIYKDDLAQDTSYRNYISKFCSLIGCSIPSYANLDYLIVEDNAIVSVPGAENRIQLFAMIKNIGKYDQRYPNLTIKFTDINGNLIQERNLKPKNYIRNYRSADQQLAKNSKQYIALQMRDPGSEAINYEISLS